MKKGKWAIILILIIVGLWYFNRSESDKAKEDGDVMEKVELNEPVVFGGLMPLSGDAISYGTPMQRATIMAINEINEAGGIGGQEVSIIWEDGKCTPKDASTSAQKLIDVDGVQFILGGVCSSEALSAAPLVEENKVILISPSATSPDITNAGEYVFRTAPSDALAGKVAAEFAYNAREFTKAAVISENTDYAQGLRGVFVETFGALGGEVVFDESFEPGIVDFASQVLKIKSSNPDVVYLVPQTDAAGVQIVKQLQQEGVTVQIIGSETMAGRDILSNNSEILEGFITIEAFYDETSERAQKFLSDYQAQYEEEAPFPYFMAAAHANVYILKDAIEANGLDTEKIKDWLIENIQNYDSTAGALSFDENGDVNAPYNILLVKNGEAESIEVVSPSH